MPIDHCHYKKLEANNDRQDLVEAITTRQIRDESTYRTYLLRTYLLVRTILLISSLCTLQLMPTRCLLSLYKLYPTWTF